MQDEPSDKRGRKPRKKKVWSPDDDLRMLQAVSKHGLGQWPRRTRAQAHAHTGTQALAHRIDTLLHVAQNRRTFAHCTEERHSCSDAAKLASLSHKRSLHKRTLVLTTMHASRKEKGKFCKRAPPWLFDVARLPFVCFRSKLPMLTHACTRIYIHICLHTPRSLFACLLQATGI